MVQQNVLEWLDGENLTVHVVWMPVKPADDEEAADRARAQVPDPRAMHYWDGDQSLGQAWRDRVKLPEGNDRLAWDIYFVYPPGSHWDDGPLGDDGPPVPRDWRHQLAADDRYLGDAETLRWSLGALMGD